MAIFGVTFANQLVSATDDAVVQRRALTDGTLRGFGVTASGSVATIAAGYVLACGRVIGNDADLAVNVSATSGVARLTLVIDLSAAATETTFSQVSIRTDLAASEAALPALVQQDINDGLSTTYEISLAVLSLGAGGITGVVSSLGQSAVVLPTLLPANVGIKMGTATPTTADISNGQIYLKYA